MEHLSRVQVLQGLEELVHGVLFVNLLENVCADDCVQVGLYVLEHQVAVSIVLRLEHIQHANYVLVIVDLLQEHDLSEGALSVGRILRPTRTR